MHSGVAPILALALTIACGGQSESSHGPDGTPSGAVAGGGSGGRTTPADGGTPAGGGTPADAGTGGQAGGPSSAYVPEHPDQPVEGDGRVSGGSFEGAQGFGWDLCRSKNPGCSYARSNPAASDGETYLRFDSNQECTASPGCTSTGGEVQVGFWLDSAIAVGEAVHLYFDVTNRGPTQPTGAIGIDAIEGMCDTRESLIQIPLEALKLDGSWQTRCVSFVPRAAFDAFGIHVVGSEFDVGVDVVRFGPPCHAP